MPRRGLYTGDYTTNERAQAFVTALVKGDVNLSTCLNNYDVASSLFLQKNDTFMRSMRTAFRDKIAEIGAELKKGNNIIENSKKLERCLCLLPLASIKPDEVYTIPTDTSSEGGWQDVAYVVTPIELSPTHGLGRLALADTDRLFAYGLTPLLAPKEGHFIPPRRLIFTDQYPGQQGYLANVYLRFQFIANFYNTCQQQISQWLKDTANALNQRNTIVYGIGNSSRIALETIYAEEAEQHIQRIQILDAYSTSYSARQNYQEKWTNLAQRPEVSVQMHKNHYNLGEIMQDWHVTNADGDKLQTNYLKSWWYNLAVGSILGGIINTLIIMPNQYIFIPLIRGILQHKMQIALLSILTMVFIMLPGLIMTDIGTTLAVFTAAYFAFKMIEPIKTLFNCNEKQEALCHKPDPLEQQENIDELRKKVTELSDGYTGPETQTLR